MVNSSFDYHFFQIYIKSDWWGNPQGEKKLAYCIIIVKLKKKKKGRLFVMNNKVFNFCLKIKQQALKFWML